MRKLRPLLLPASLGLILAAITTVPYLVAFWQPPASTHFLGFFFTSDDANVYLAQMRQGFEGSWTWSNHYTTEFTDTSPLFVFWMALGHLSALTHLSLYATFELARILGAVTLVFAAWLFVRDFLPQSMRPFALLFLVLVPGGGLILLLLGEPYLLGQTTYALDFRFPELSLFVSSLSLPHYIWSAVFIAVGTVFTLAAAERASLKHALVAILAWSGLATIHPQMVPLMGFIFALALILRPTSRKGMLMAALVFATQVPYILYAYSASLTSPEISNWLAQGGDDFVPSPLSFLLSFWPQLLPGIFGIAIALRRRSRRDLLLVAWLAMDIIILYFPVLPASFALQRRRFLDGLYLPLAILAVEGLYAILVHVSAHIRSLTKFAYVALGALLPIFMITASILHPPAAAFMPNDEYQIFASLNSHPPGLVLSDASIGLDIPARTDDQVYVGHSGETFNYASKEKQVCALFSSGNDAALEAFISANHVRYLVWTPGCSPSFAFDPTQLPTSWQLIYSAKDARVYRVF